MGQQCVIVTGYTGEDGVEIMIGNAFGVALWEELIKRDAAAASFSAIRCDSKSLAALWAELNEDIDPFQAGLAWAVKMDKGDFRGKDALARRQKDASLRRRIGIEMKGKRIAREGAAIKSGGQTIGAVTSGTPSPTLGKPIAMGYVDAAFAAVGTPLVIDIRGNDEEAVVVAMPFYKRKK